MVKEATALGCAIAAGVGVGLYEALDKTGERLVRWEREYIPNTEHKALYQAAKLTGKRCIPINWGWWIVG